MKRLFALAAAITAGEAAPVLAQSLRADTDGITATAGPVELTLGGRLHVDAATFDAAPGQPDTAADLRRARLELNGKVGRVIRFRVDREFSGGGAGGWRNLWVAARPVKGVELRGGNFNVPFSMEELQSSNSSPLAERSLASALAPGYGLGASAALHGKRWTATAGFFGDALANENGRFKERGRGVAGRITALPYARGHKFLHLGLAAEGRTFDSTEQLRFSSNAGTVLAPSLQQSQRILHLDTLRGWNAEAALGLGPVLVQGQFIALRIKRHNRSTLDFAGHYVQASWMLTGERYGYSAQSGLPGGPTLRKGRSAVELALRYSGLDLDDGPVNAGVSHALTLGATYYASRNVRLMANATESWLRDPATGQTSSSLALMTRMQIAF